MKQFVRKFSILFCVIFICVTAVSATATLIPGGQVIGLNLDDGTLTVVKVENPASGLQVGDKIRTLNGEPITDVAQLKAKLTPETNTLTVTRNGKPRTLTVTGAKLGVYLRQGVSGLGTVTYYDPKNNTFGALGHGVCQSGGGLTQMTAGQVFSAKTFSVKAGKIGAPGQLMGSITTQNPLGLLSKNTRQGIFGKMPCIQAEPLPVATKDQVQTGDATIYSTVCDQGLREYSVKILKIYPTGADNRNLLLKVTDPALLQTTGGIVQGMSGSPIIQNGHIIGAVTHVLVNDPTTGYGIFIENMLEAAA